MAAKQRHIQYNVSGQFQSIAQYLGDQLAVQSDYTYNAAGQLTGLVHQQGGTVLAQYAWTYGSGTAMPQPRP